MSQPISDEFITIISNKLNPTLIITAREVPGLETFNFTTPEMYYLSKKVVVSNGDKPYILDTTRFALVQDLDGCRCNDIYYIGMGPVFADKFDKVKRNYVSVNKAPYIIPYHSINYNPYSVIYIKKTDPDNIVIHHSLEWSNNYL